MDMDFDEEAAWLEEEKAIEAEEAAKAAQLVEEEEAARKRARLEVDSFPLSSVLMSICLVISSVQLVAVRSILYVLFLFFVVSLYLCFCTIVDYMCCSKKKFAGGTLFTVRPPSSQFLSPPLNTDRDMLQS